MTREKQTYQPSKPKRMSASVHMHADCYEAVLAYANSFKPPMSLSGTIHKLLRSHPQLNLEDFQ